MGPGSRVWWQGIRRWCASRGLRSRGRIRGRGEEDSTLEKTKPCHPERSPSCAKRKTDVVEGPQALLYQQERRKAFSRRRVVEIPRGACGTVQGREVHRLRKKSASRTSYCAQDDRRFITLRITGQQGITLNRPKSIASANYNCSRGTSRWMPTFVLASSWSVQH